MGTWRILNFSLAVGEVTEDAQQTSTGGSDREGKNSAQRICLWWHKGTNPTANVTLAMKSFQIEVL